MIIKSVAGLAFAAVCLTAIATLPAHAQGAAQTGPGLNPGGNSVGTYGPNPGGPGLTPYSGGAPGAYAVPGAYPAPGAYAPQTQYVPPPSDEPPPGGTQVMTNGPQTNPGDVSPSWSARRNVAESERYDRLVETNRAFRQARERKECGPITDPQLHQQCVDSFAQYEPSGATGYGSSQPTGSQRSNNGR
jgi:hypothetical protein